MSGFNQTAYGKYTTGPLFATKTLNVVDPVPSNTSGDQRTDLRFYGANLNQTTNAPGELVRIIAYHDTGDADNHGRLSIIVNDGTTALPNVTVCDFTATSMIVNAPTMAVPAGFNLYSASGNVNIGANALTHFTVGSTGLNAYNTDGFNVFMVDSVNKIIRLGQSGDTWSIIVRANIPSGSLVTTTSGGNLISKSFVASSILHSDGSGGLSGTNLASNLSLVGGTTYKSILVENTSGNANSFVSIAMATNIVSRQEGSIEWRGNTDGFRFSSPITATIGTSIFSATPVGSTATPLSVEGTTNVANATVRLAFKHITGGVPAYITYNNSNFVIDRGFHSGANTIYDIGNPALPYRHVYTSTIKSLNTYKHGIDMSSVHLITMNVGCDGGSATAGVWPLRVEYYGTTNTAQINYYLSPGPAANPPIRFFIIHGAMAPANDNTMTLGRSINRFNEIFCTNGTINVSDSRLKQNVTTTTYGLNFIAALRPVKYRLIDNESGRFHQGLIAQEVKTVMDAQGITPADFAGFIHSTGPVTNNHSVLNEQTGQYENVTETVEVDRYGLRYTEFIGPMIKAIQELKAQVDYLTSLL